MTRPRIQIAVDARDPHALCRFWAAALDYRIEDHHDQVLALVEQGAHRSRGRPLVRTGECGGGARNRPVVRS